jgi:hypothetical protein
MIMKEDDLLGATAHVFGLSVADLTSRAKTRRIAAARHAAAYILQHRCTSLSQGDIGELLGGRDASTISDAIRVAERLMKDDPTYRSKVDQVLRPAASVNLNLSPLVLAVLERLAGMNDDQLRRMLAYTDAVQLSVPERPQRVTLVA